MDHAKEFSDVLPGCFIHIYFLFTEFILLENLVAGLNHPSIIDLKMGTRTHGEDDSSVKIQEKIEKAQRSTTSKLGVRLHGMQVKILTLLKYTG